jgi:hypothetical protein
VSAHMKGVLRSGIWQEKEGGAAHLDPAALTISAPGT